MRIFLGHAFCEHGLTGHVFCEFGRAPEGKVRIELWDFSRATTS